MRLYTISLVGLVACGRLNFDERSDARRPADAFAGAIGCSDGEREALIDRVRFPTIAACGAAWNGTPSLRAVGTAVACGDDLGSCAAPADACALGWHICGESGDLTELADRMTSGDCDSAGGPTDRFVAAADHCSACTGTCTSTDDCAYTPPYGCRAGPAPCQEPVCCGPGCRNVTLCTDSVYPGATHAGTDMQGCGALGADSQSGVLCCSD